MTPTDATTLSTEAVTGSAALDALRRSNGSSAWRAAFAIAAKDLRLLARDRTALFWVIGFPCLFAVFFGSVLSSSIEGASAPLEVAVEDLAKTPESARVVEVLRRAGARVRPAAANDGERAVKSGRATALLRIPTGFGERPVALDLGVDPTRTTEGRVIETVLSAALHEARAGAGQAPATAPVRRHGIGPRSGFEVFFAAMILWGLLGCAATFAVSIVSERNAGTYLRLRAGPSSRAAIVTGKALACLGACLLDAALLSAIGVFGLGVHVDQPGLFALAVTCTAFCFSGLTMALSATGKSEQAVAGAGWATLIVLAMLGGAMVPLSLLPSWVLDLSALSPVKWGIYALEGAAWRGLRPDELAKPLAILLGVGFAGFGLGTALLSKHES